MAAHGMGRGKVVLELSEQDDYQRAFRERSDQSVTLLNYLMRFSREAGVEFAIDDFGVGHSSLDRLSSLTLAHVKIDRSILSHSLALKEIELVVEVADLAFANGTSPTGRRIVLEGVDEDCTIPLRDLRRAGVNYIQGFLMEPNASEEIMPVSSERRSMIAAMLAEQSPRLPTQATGDNERIVK